MGRSAVGSDSGMHEPGEPRLRNARHRPAGRPGRGRARPLLALLVLLGAVALASAAQAVAATEITNSGDNFRDGWYPEQGSLTPSLVSGGTFGQLWSANVEGQVYAQPLLAAGTLLVATEANKVYGLDPATGALKWAAPLNLGTPFKAADIGCADLAPNLGVTATPVVDPATNIAYMTHKTYVSGSSGASRWYMDAVEVATGKERAGFPVELAGSAQNAPSQKFEPETELQRPGLLLMNGVVYAGFGSDCDHTPWQGWVFGVSTEGKVTARWTSRPSGDGAGIWQSGAGLTSDGSGTILLSTGNGGAPTVPTPGSSPPASLGESVVRLRVQPDGSLKAVDFFAPFDAVELDAHDADFASGGVTALNEQFFGTLTTPRLAVAVGKDGYVYLLNRENLGGFQQASGGGDNVVDRVGPYGGVWSRPGVWGGEGGWVYIPTASGGPGGYSGFLRVYQYGVSGSGQPTLALQGTSSDAFGFSSGAPVITSNGTAAGSALVWIIWASNGAGEGGQLRAYNPIPVEGKPVLRWSAPIGTASKFSTPGVGAGRLYVGTREGKVLAFGSPVTPPLTGGAVSFPTTTIGSESQQTLTLTATSSLTLSKLSSSSSQFTVGTPSIALPAQLAAGQKIQVPLTFKPTQTGLIGGTLSAETSAGPASFSMSGLGQSAAAQLTSSPTVESFGGTAVGGELAGTATFRNVGSAPLTINAVKLPGAPFSASGVPAVGSTLEPGASVTIPVTFKPTAIGNYSSEIALESTGGNASVALTGSAGTPGSLKITSETNNFGSVTVGGEASKSFTITNTGGTAVTITKSKPPLGGAYQATTALSEGSTIAPGETVTETVKFKPEAPGYASGVWLINGEDSTGLHEVSFKGTGSVPAPGAAWSHNGNASISGGVIHLTAASSWQVGSSFFTTPLESRHLTIEYEQTINSGSGADGLTLTFADASKTTSASIGAAGGGLGFSGLSGIAVAFDTYKNAVNPSNNFVGITNGPKTSGEPYLLNWLTTSTSIPALRTATRHVKVELLNGTLSVWVEGTRALSSTVTVAPKVLLGFTGATGGSTDVHQVANVSVSGEPEPSGPPSPASLQISSSVNAPSGSPQAAAKFTYSGSCPSSFTTAALASGESATPTLTGAVAGASCTVAQAAPSEAGWGTTVSVNGGPETPLTASGGQLTVPGFALAAGANSVHFTNTYTASTTSIPDPSAGGWQLNGKTALSGSELVLTGAVQNAASSAFWPHTIDPRNMTVEFEAFLGGGTGADGLALVIADATRGATAKSLGALGGGLGFAGIPGWAVALDTYKNSANPSANFVGITEGPLKSSEPYLLKWVATDTLATSVRGSGQHVKVVTSNGNITVSINGTQVLNGPLVLSSSAYLGFSAGTGGLTDRHVITHLVVS